MRKLLERILLRDSAVEEFRLVHEFERIGPRVLLVNAHCMSCAGRPDAILLAIEDRTDVRRAIKLFYC